jgi:preprotein translocase subunit SecF
MFISIVIMLVSVALFSTKGINYGIDFTGGIEVQVKFQDEKVN